MSGAGREGRGSAARMPNKAKREVICDASDSRKKEMRIAHYTLQYFMRRLAGRVVAARPVIFRAKRYFAFSSHGYLLIRTYRVFLRALSYAADGP